jgi:histidyl-tRNA synthetase
VGWGSGLERIAQAIEAGDVEAVGVRTSFLFAVTEPQARQRVFRAISELREEGVGATMDLGGRSLKTQLKQASKAGIAWVVIIGPQEWESETATIRDMNAASQEQIPLARLRDELAERAGTP